MESKHYVMIPKVIEKYNRLRNNISKSRNKKNVKPSIKQCF